MGGHLHQVHLQVAALDTSARQYAEHLKNPVERTARKLKRRKTAFEAAGLTEDAQAASIRLRRLNQEYRVFSKAAGLPEQRERMRALYANRKLDKHRSSAGTVMAMP